MSRRPSIGGRQRAQTRLEAAFRGVTDCALLMAQFDAAAFLLSPFVTFIRPFPS